MTSKIKYLSDRNLICPPKFVTLNIQYETIMGSESYGVSSGDSDVDIYGWCIPPKEIIFPHLNGEILGFGTQQKRFEQFQQHHVIDDSSQKQYDVNIYNIVKYFQLCMENNPNMIDSLFTPRRCVLHSTQISELVRDNRKLFLHKGSWFKFRGYAFSQLNKMKNKNPIGKRKNTIKKYGFDVKFAYHIVRLLNEVEQILTEHNIDLERDREMLKSIRRGEWSIQDIEEYFTMKERLLEKLYTESSLQHSPDQQKIKNLLLQCLELYYGTLEKCIYIEKDVNVFIADIISLIKKSYPLSPSLKY